MAGTSTCSIHVQEGFVWQVTYLVSHTRWEPLLLPFQWGNWHPLGHPSGADMCNKMRVDEPCFVLKTLHLLCSVGSCLPSPGSVLVFNGFSPAEWPLSILSQIGWPHWLWSKHAGSGYLKAERGFLLQKSSP